MARHEFGIMRNAPEQGKRYDEYEPQKYEYITVDDAYLENIIEKFDRIDCYWHTLDVKRKGLAYCGITLIPPCSIEAFIGVIENVAELTELKELGQKALNENKWIIHFGL